MRTFFFILLSAGMALAQNASVSDVIVDGNGTLVAPTNLWTANAGGINAALGNVTTTANASLSLATTANSTATTALSLAGTANATATTALTLAGTANATATTATQRAGNETVTGAWNFHNDIAVGNVTYTAAQDGILTITTNGTALEVVGNGTITLPDTNTVELLFDDPNYYWSDQNNFWNQGPGSNLAGTTAADVATGLRAWLEDYSTNAYLDPDFPTIGGTGTNVTITYTGGPFTEGWASSNATVLPLVETQEGSAAGWSGTQRSVRLYNSDNGKLYQLKITGTPNPVLTLTEVTE